MDSYACISVYYRKLEDNQLEQCLKDDKHYKLVQTTRGRKLTATATSKRSNQPEVVTISAHELQVTTQQLGEGCFGKCTVAIYKETYEVCMKSLKGGLTAESHLLQEARMLCKVSGHTHIPHCFGVCKSMMAVVMSLHTVEGKSLTLEGAMHSNGNVMEKESGIKYLTQVATALSHVHNKGYLHNDVKGNNIVLGTTRLEDVQAYLTDFGKSCHQTEGKIYSLPVIEREIYKIEHPHIAPDLRDGLTSQSIKTDIFSLGRLIRKMCHRYSIVGELNNIATSCLLNTSKERPDMGQIIHALQARH